MLELKFKDGTVQQVPFDSSSTLSVTVNVIDQEREPRIRTLAWSEIVGLRLVDEPAEPVVEVEAPIEPVDAATSAPQKPRQPRQQKPSGGE